jgi:hypothetical protein
LILWAFGVGGSYNLHKGFSDWGIRGVPSMEMAVMGCVFGEIERIRKCNSRNRLVSRGIMRLRLNENQNYARKLRQCYRRRKCCPWHVVLWEIRLKEY